MTLGAITQVCIPIFEDRKGNRFQGEPVPFGFVRDSEGYTTFGMALVGVTFPEE